MRRPPRRRRLWLTTRSSTKSWSRRGWSSGLAASTRARRASAFGSTARSAPSSTGERAEKLGGALGPYALQAAIAACHARAPTAAKTDWPRIVALYDAVAQIAPSPVVELNRAVAVGMAFGPAAGLDLVDALVPEPSLKAYHLLPAVRGDLLRKLGRFEEARAEFERAASLTENVVERELLERRAAECTRGAVGGLDELSARRAVTHRWSLRYTASVGRRCSSVRLCDDLLGRKP